MSAGDKVAAVVTVAAAAASSPAGNQQFRWHSGKRYGGGDMKAPACSWLPNLERAGRCKRKLAPTERVAQSIGHFDGRGTERTEQRERGELRG